MESLLNGPYDQAGCRLLITAGAGGADAADWAGILLRMYQRLVSLFFDTSNQGVIGWSIN